MSRLGIQNYEHLLQQYSNLWKIRGFGHTSYQEVDDVIGVIEKPEALKK
jgi:hypothetical protein